MPGKHAYAIFTPAEFAQHGRAGCAALVETPACEAATDEGYGIVLCYPEVEIPVTDESQSGVRESDGLERLGRDHDLRCRPQYIGAKEGPIGVHGHTFRAISETADDRRREERCSGEACF